MTEPALEALQQRNWQIGGESSGHILVLDKHSTGDGIISALQVLQAVASPGPGDLEACLEHGLLVQNGQELTFRHELARQAMAAALALWRRREVHRQVLRALEARPAPVREPGRLVARASEWRAWWLVLASRWERGFPGRYGSRCRLNASLAL